MSDSQYLAHRAEDGRVETVQQHLTETGSLAAHFAQQFGAEAQGSLAGLAHDIGKYSSAFQKRLNGDPAHVDHSTAGAIECIKLNQIPAALVVAGHHGGLPDLGTRTDSSDEPTLMGRFRRAQTGQLEPYDHWNTEITLPQAAMPTDLASRAEVMFFTRMLYSCLVDADFLCTEAFMKGEHRQCEYPDMAELNARLELYIRNWYPPKTELNTLRCNALDSCREKGNSSCPGLFTLTVPTGGGKTVASLAFALSQAKTWNKQRIIYVIPYTSIIEQNAQVFRDILGEDAVLEHHSGILYNLEQEADPRTIHMAQATENWDMPVVVTTAVQFFESLFACRSSKCRKLHNLADSVIIFDEAQMLPLPYLRPCVWAIAQLVRHYGATAVLCTATQPALAPLFQEFLPNMPPIELCPPEISRNPIFRRVTFRKAGKTSLDSLSATLNQQDQVLCIVNSRKSAQEIYCRFSGEGCYHLSTLMYPTHRQRILAEIRQRLSHGRPCRVVSTSLIEAGVDVDFPAVYREEAGLDSILQAAGRCNREGRYPTEESIVTVFSLDIKPPDLFSAAIGATQTVMACFNDIASHEAIAAYFRELLELKGPEAQDQKGIMGLMEEQRLPFREIAERFHLIESTAKTVYIPLEDGEELVRRLRDGEHSRSLFRSLGKYGVSVYPQHFDALVNAGALEVLEDGSAILSNCDLYNMERGLTLDVESGNLLMI